MSSIQLVSYGSYIRITTDSSVLLLEKTQVKSLEVVRQDTVKLSIGEGTLNEILVKLSDVTQPAGLVDVAALRDSIAQILDEPDGYEVEALAKQQSQIEELIAIRQLFNLLNGSIQIDLNFQQLQVNALIAIGNRLLEAKENDERMIGCLQDQTSELKAQSLQLTAADTWLTAIKAATESALIKQDAHAGLLTDIKISSGLLQTILADILNELKAQTNKLSTIDTTVSDLRTQNATSHNKQDAQTQLLSEIKVLLANQP
jgi:hypothetical protein